MGNPLTKKPVELVSLNHLNIPVPTDFIEVKKNDGDEIKDLLLYNGLYLQLQNKKTGKITDPILITNKLKMSEHSLFGNYVEIENKPFTILRRLKEKNMFGGKRRTRKTRKQGRLSRKSRVSRHHTRRA